MVTLKSLKSSRSPTPSLLPSDVPGSNNHGVGRSSVALPDENIYGAFSADLLQVIWISGAMKLMTIFGHPILLYPLLQTRTTAPDYFRCFHGSS